MFPLQSMKVTSPYGMRIHPVKGDYTFHNGTDYVASERTPIHSPFKQLGTVVIAAYDKSGYGYYEVIDYGVFQMLIAHLDELTLRTGMTIRQGMLIGHTGVTGSIKGPHLHLEIRIGRYNHSTFWNRDFETNRIDNTIDSDKFIRSYDNMEKITFEEVVKLSADSPEKWIEYQKAQEAMSRYVDDLVVKAYQRGYENGVASIVK